LPSRSAAPRVQTPSQPADVPEQFADLGDLKLQSGAVVVAKFPADRGSVQATTLRENSKVRRFRLVRVLGVGKFQDDFDIAAGIKA
jgi:hypothetical protein